MPLGPVLTSINGVELDQEERERLQSPVIGGVVLFARNCESIDQIRRLTTEIHQLRTPQLLIAVDQEGGRVQRIKSDVTILPPAAVYGAIFNQNEDKGCDAAELGGYLMAREVLETGIDLSFSPVLDVSTVRSDVIGDRSFHQDPHAVAQLAESWIRGMRTAGMHAVGKHFPGHGGVSADSHTEVPEDKREIEKILNCDLVPYRRLEGRLAGIMTGHVCFPEITSAVPTYSSFWLEHILREILVFDGVVFSDDLSMSGAADAGDMDARVLTALSSGCDVALICQSVADTDSAIDVLMQNRKLWKSIDWIYDQLRPGEIDRDYRIDQCRRALEDCIQHFA